MGFQLFLAVLQLLPPVEVSATSLRAARRRLDQATKERDRDLDDAIYLACAVDGDARLLTSEDSDLLNLSGVYEGVAIDQRVLGFTFTMSLLTSLIFGILPALQISKPKLNESLKEGGQGSGGVIWPGLRSLLVISEVALSLVLLVGAGLMIKSFRHLRAVDPGFDQERVLSMRLSLPRAGYQQPAQTAAFYEQLMRSLAALPGVAAAGAIDKRLFTGDITTSSFVIEGRIAPAGQWCAPPAMLQH